MLLYTVRYEKARNKTTLGIYFYLKQLHVDHQKKKTGKKYAMFISGRWVYGCLLFYLMFLHFSVLSKYSFNTCIFYNLKKKDYF